MPVVVNNMNVKTSVSGGRGQNTSSSGGGISKKEKEVIIRECIERVLDLLEEKQSR
jgi:hypothetical protein